MRNMPQKDEAAATAATERVRKHSGDSSVYVALARAAGVPAREVLGIRMGKEEVEDITTWQHCWAEFYLPGHGWVAVDPADVRKKMLVEKPELNDPKTEDYREYFWGGLDPFRVKLGEGRDLVLNPPQHGEPVNYLMYPFAQVGEETLDWLDPAKFSYSISYHQLHQDGYALIDTASLKKLLDMEPADLVVVDARDPEEFNKGHIPGAINIPSPVFASQSEVLDKDKQIIVYCSGGGRSYNAYRKLMKLGYEDIRQVLFFDWQEEGLPVEKSEE